MVCASSARQASSARLNVAWMPQIFVYSRAGIASGPRRRISLQRNADSSPSIASTTSSTVISAGGLGEAVAALGALDGAQHARAGEGLEVLGEVRGGDAVVLGELGRGERGVVGQRRQQHAHVHAPLDPVGHSHNPDTTYPRTSTSSASPSPNP